MTNSYLTSELKPSQNFFEKFRTTHCTSCSNQEILNGLDEELNQSCIGFEEMIKLWHITNEDVIEKIFKIRLQENEIISYYEINQAKYFKNFLHNILNTRLQYVLDDINFEEYKRAVSISFVDYSTNIMSDLRAIDHFENQAKNYPIPNALFHTYNEMKLVLESNEDQRKKIDKGNDLQFLKFTKRIASYLQGKALVPKYVPIEIIRNNNNYLIKKHIALICHYNDRPITKDNALGIANEFGHDKAGRLYQEFCIYHSQTDRLSTGELSPIRLANKKRIFEVVIEQLSGKAKEKAQDDLNTIIAKTKKSNTL